MQMTAQTTKVATFFFFFGVSSLRVMGLGREGVFVDCLPPAKVISAEYIRPALEERVRNTMQVKIFEKIRAAQGTPRELVRPMKRGALPLRAMKSIVRDATYNEPFPAEMTLITIRALMRCAAGRMPASVSAMVKGELAAVEVELRSLGWL